MTDKPPLRYPTEQEFANMPKLLRQEASKRLPAKGGRVAALNKLHDILVNDANLYCDSVDLQGQRDAVSHALLAVVDYLHEQGFGTHAVAPLMRPVFSLVEREKGSLDLLFAERMQKTGGRSKRTSTENERLGVLAAFADTWLNIEQKDGLNQADSLKRCATVLRGRYFGQISASQLKYAREIVSQELPDHPACLTYNNFCQHLKKFMSQFGAKSGFKVMLRAMNDHEIAFGAGEGGICKTPPVSPIGDS